jgi:NAD+ kinase
MNVAIYGRTYSDEYFTVFNKIFNELIKSQCSVSIYKDLWDQIQGKFSFSGPPALFSKHSDIQKNTDFVFSIGGDGTLLNTITLVKDSGIPVLGFNTGRLGFLSSVNGEEIESAIKSLKLGAYEKESRSLICLTTPGNIFKGENFALNEVCLHRKDSSSMISVNAYVNNLFLNTYWADGLIVSTPTGSTAYSLSCGGPIVTPDSKNFIITPVSTHNLTVRPIVVPDDSEIRLKAEGRDNNFLVSLDSRSETIQSDVELIIRKHPDPFILIKLPEMNFFNTIREKLMWGMDKRN